MTARILDGRLVARQQKEQIKAHIEERSTKLKRPPGLAVILVGDDPASHIYVQNKRKACEYVGIESKYYALAKHTSQDELLVLIAELNCDDAIDGILVQLPLPAHIDDRCVLEHIEPSKDVDGFHPYNLGRLAQKFPLLRPCTPYGIMQLLHYYGIEVKGTHCTVVGASTIVGRPMALELLLAGATVTICHRFTKNLAQYVKLADIVIVAIGKREIICNDWLKPNCVAIDVGIHRLADGQLSGDLDFHAVQKIAAWITPVPGGVGPMTIAVLLSNTLSAADLRQKIT